MNLAEPGLSSQPRGLRSLLKRPRLILAVIFLTVLLYGVWGSWLIMVATGSPETEGQPKVDFLSYWTGSQFALDGEASAAYDSDRVYQEQFKIHGEEDRSFDWLYPPTFFFFVLPLALLPIVPSLVAWFVATAALAMSALRRVNRDTTAIVLAFAFPATFWNIVTGQNGLLTAGLFAWGILLARNRPVAAGLILGLLIYKPQFFPLIPLALWAGGHRSAAISAVASAGALSLASLVAFGPGSWVGFVHAATQRSDLIYAGEALPEKMQSITGALLVAGLPQTLIQIVQGGVALVCAAFVIWLWRRPAVSFEYKAVGLTLAMLLATPYSYHYDLTLLGLVIVWLGDRIRREGWLAWDAEILALTWITPLLTLMTGVFLGFSIGPLVLLLLLATLLRRLGAVARLGSGHDPAVSARNTSLAIPEAG